VSGATKGLGVGVTLLVVSAVMTRSLPASSDGSARPRIGPHAMPVAVTTGYCDHATGSVRVESLC
jgi:hypothetical protein